MLTPNRTSTREESERRIEDRRVDNNEFNSLQWVENMKINYVSWPKFDRRQKSRRNNERRQNTIENFDLLNAPNNNKEDISGNILTKEEKLFFMSLFNDNNN